MKETLDDLRLEPPGMVIADAKKNFSFSINYGNPTMWKKGTGRILSMYLYLQLEKDKKGNARIHPSKNQFREKYKAYQGQNLSGKSVLIWRTGGLGDLCFINPSMRWMKKQWPDCKIYFACSPTYKYLIENWSCIDQFVDFPVPSIYLDKCNYHVTFEGVIERCREAEKTNAYKLFSQWLGLEIPKEELIPEFSTDSKFDAFVDEYLKQNNLDNFIVAQLRTSSPIRTPPTECWSNIFVPLLKDGHKIVITDAPRMYDRLNKFIELAIPEQYRNQVYNFSKHSSDIKASVSLINRARMAISPDTSMIHLAQAINCPTLGIYGAFPGEIRMSTYKNVDWVEPSESDVCKFKGRHCCLHGQSCDAIKKGGVAPCYGYLDYEEVYSKACRLLKAREEGYEREQPIEEGENANE